MVVATTLGSDEDDLGIISAPFGFMLGPCFGECWDHMRLYRDHFGSCWGHVGVVLDNLGII